MTDLSRTIAAKSDQLNADDLIGRSITVTITDVRGSDDPDQPIAISYQGDGGKPYKPCKSMRRVMVHLWKADGKQYVGRRMTLYRDDDVQFGGIKVGGIRISHMSHIDREVSVALTAKRGTKKPYTVKPLRADVKGIENARQEPAGDDFPGDRDRSFGAERQAPSEGFTGWAAVAAADIDQKTAVSDLDAYSDDPDVVESFQQLAASDPAQAKKLEAKLRGRRKVLLDRERG